MRRFHDITSPLLTQVKWMSLFFELTDETRSKAAQKIF